MENILNVRVELRGGALTRFIKIKTRVGIENSTDVVRFLINDYYYRYIESEPKPVIIE